ncbi:MAG: serine/threonine protein kinase [Chloroflexi bacterium]|nr:serine/threonine protein kinase [Chloroflexota bacterium]
MEVGSEFSHYRVVEHIGRGGMADVWSARDQRLGRTVAVKTVARNLTIQGTNPVTLFEREAQTIAGLEHPYILPIHEFGDYQGQLYIVMRYVSGGSLEDRLEQGPMTLHETIRMGRLIGQALDYAHENKVIHLDIKPSNVLLDTSSLPYLADFGLAAVLGPEGRAANPGSGTLLYMAPEQLTSTELDHRADIYSFGVLIFHMLTGQLPFDAAVSLALRQVQASEVMPDIRAIKTELPGGITELLRGCTHIEPAQRPGTLHDIMNALETIIMPGRAVLDDTAVVARAPVPRGPNAPTEPADDETRPRIEIDTEDLMTQPLDPITGPISRLPSVDEISDETQDQALGLDLPELSLRRLDLDSAPQPMASTEQIARREAEDLYARARRTWAHGQGRFLLGVTHFTIINDYYRDAAANQLDLDEGGTQMLLRGALEYDLEIDYWWRLLSDESRRWVTLHAIRSENATARIRALERLHDLPDSDPPQIPKLVAQALQVETNRDAKLAAIQVLEIRARLRASQTILTQPPQRGTARAG